MRTVGAVGRIVAELTLCGGYLLAGDELAKQRADSARGRVTVGMRDLWTTIREPCGFTRAHPRLSLNRIVFVIAIVSAVIVSGCGVDDVSTGSQVSTDVSASEAWTTATPLANGTMITTSEAQYPRSDSTPYQASTPDWSVPLGVSVAIDSVYYASLGELAWASDAIVIGVVVEARAPQYIENHDPHRPSDVPQADPAHIFTDYIIKVDRVLRGNGTDNAVIRQQGGTIQNVTVTNLSEPEMKIGYRGLFFLQRIETPVPTNGDSVTIVHVAAATWWVEGQSLVPALPTGSEEHPPTIPSEMMMSEIAVTLRGAPIGADAVPMSSAPLGPDLP
ncbi:MAG: hypothetical protein V9F06_14950 [Thermomicrobiales bacterium]